MSFYTGPETGPSPGLSFLDMVSFRSTQDKLSEQFSSIQRKVNTASDFDSKACLDFFLFPKVICKHKVQSLASLPTLCLFYSQRILFCRPGIFKRTFPSEFGCITNLHLLWRDNVKFVNLQSGSNSRHVISDFDGVGPCIIYKWYYADRICSHCNLTGHSIH
eukprot:TRINITY_DN397_c0_g2_i12.p1 TRINITY_DN397_c0_g2~~TRINITY_DN397_c0_g2_i12.p1  ORF type:complete len:162 (+),score=5.29 TRINITY_DN397_c0_g2_i12:258-743(+)